MGPWLIFHSERSTVEEVMDQPTESSDYYADSYSHFGIHEVPLGALAYL